MKNLISRSLLLIPLLFALGALRPEAAHACVWNLAHFGNPMPPCEQKDENEISRIRQANVKVGEKLIVVATKIMEVKREVALWQASIETAKSLEWQLRDIYGNLVADPIPSMLMAYRESNIAQYVNLEYDANGKIRFDMVDYKEKADSIWMAFGDTMNLKAKYEYHVRGEVDRWERQYIRTSRILDDRLEALTDYEASSQALLDSMTATGNRIATRYQGRGDVEGVSEAKISTLSAELSRLRGTTFEVKAEGISARMRALDGAIEKNDAIRQRAIARQGTRF